MRYIVRRAITYAVVLFVALQLDFILPRLAPGSAASVLAPASKFAPQAAALITARFGLDQPLSVQYVLFLKNIFLNWPPFFGVSFVYYPIPVTTLFFQRFLWTLLLIGTSFALAVIISYFMAAAATLRRAGKFDIGALYTSVVLQAVPVYWFALVLLWVFGVYLGWLPLFGNAAFGATGQSYVVSVAEHAILPITVLTLSQLGENYMLLRGSAQEVLQSDYITSAKTRGLKNSTLSFTYIMRNSLLPFVSISSFSIASLISRVVLVEAVFGYPGVGDLIVDAALGRDFPVLQGSLFLVTVIVIIGGLVGDVLLTRLDSRIK
ncbi:MAG: ABC transporter permease [Thaumarchaeota archaeon]|nr:ABC transporter permease [Nitrososphaerota archaeon]